MLRTSICDLLDIEFPIIQAGMGPFTSADLVAAVSNAGALGSLGAGARPLKSFQEHLVKIHELTKHPYAVNFTLSPVVPDPAAFSLTLKAKPRLVSFSLGDPDDHIERVHAAGILVMHQVTNVQQAYHAAEIGVDIIVAQGSEAGGFGGTIAGLVLIPQVVDAVSPVPVVAAGGVAEGRGLAAALVLGAQGVNIGTRFLVSSEAPISEHWKQSILEAESQDAIKVELWNDIFPTGGKAYQTIPRTLRSPFIEEWQNQRDVVRQKAKQLQNEVASASESGRLGELFPFTGQTAGLIRDILPAAEIVHEMVNEAEAALQQISNCYK
jgi:enoyl-[acyl-carrier protein] reductase II